MAITIRTSLAEPETGQAFIPHRPERPAKAEGGKPFRIVSDYQPAGDQPQAIEELVHQFRAEEKNPGPARRHRTTRLRSRRPGAHGASRLSA